MTIRLRTAFFILLGVLFLLFFYIERAIFTPFILAGIFAYVFNPVINFLSFKIKLPRTLSVIIIYILIIAIMIALGVMLSSRILHESSDFSSYARNLSKTAKQQIATLPLWIRPAVDETILSLERSKLFSPQYLFYFFPQAISRIVSFTIFLFAGFYFLKEGRSMFDKILNFIPTDYKIEVEILFRKINAVLNGYLRGQLFMVFFVSLVLFIALSILGVRFALILGVFSGFAEIVPFIGPIIATTVAAIVVFTTGTTNFNLAPTQAVIAVIIIYFVVRQFQDYFITPHVMGRITQLHPLIILLAVLSGEHMGGILGVILAVPVAATIRILLEYCLDKVNEQEEIAS